MNNRKIGSRYEDMAADYIKSQGLQIIEKNFYSKFGEIDIIAIDLKQNMIIFYEVKFRKNERYGSPFEAVDYRKQQKIRKTAQYFLVTHRQYAEYQVRFDVIGICGNHISCILHAF